MFRVVQLYAIIYGFFKDKWGLNIRGLGFALDRIKRDRWIDLQGLRLYFNANIARAYGRNVAGSWNEPETHVFLNHILNDAPTRLSFVDVGSSVGEMVLDIGRHPAISKIFAFEPNKQCADVLRLSAEANQFEHIEVAAVAVGFRTGTTAFVREKAIVTSRVVHSTDGGFGERVHMVTLDDYMPSVPKHSIVLIDVEGGELDVLRGSRHFLRKTLPIVLFEFHAQSQSDYSLDEIQEALPLGYQIFRLRSDGKLDSTVYSAWNCVAWPSGARWLSKTLNSLRKGHT